MKDIPGRKTVFTRLETGWLGPLLWRTLTQTLTEKQSVQAGSGHARRHNAAR